MAGRKPKADRVDPTWPADDEDNAPISEFTAVNQGALSPFGEDIEFPLKTINYEHPGPETRPN